MKYIIVQAGGKGRRMEILTRNKPKALVPVQNLPMIFHLFRLFKGAKFIIVGDYKFDVLERYLRAFGSNEADYELVRATGFTGTCAGLKQALQFIPPAERFMFIWCDLLLPDKFTMPDSCENLLGISKDFSCRWSYVDGGFAEQSSKEHGVAGFFVFKDKELLLDAPDNGEFVRWLQGQHIPFKELPLTGAKEYGLYQEWLKLPRMRCRPFNAMEIEGDRVTKRGIDNQGIQLGKREVAWYDAMQGLEFKNMPKIYSTNPLCMELIDGKNIYEYTYVN